MRKHFGLSAVACLFYAGLSFAGSGMAVAQDGHDGITPPPKVLQIIVESLKPGQEGSAHQKTESAFVQAFTAAKWPEHYLAMDTLSGKPRSIFFIRYDSFAAWQKDIEATQKDPTLSAALDSASLADGQLLESHETSIYTLRDDLSLRAGVKIEDMRYMEITIFRIKAGQASNWANLAKMYMSAYEKMPNAHWATYEKMYGANESGSRFIAVTPMKSLADVDQEMADDKGLAAAVGPDQMKKMAELSASTTESIESNVVMINPKLSYVPDSWIKASPEFWGQK